MDAQSRCNAVKVSHIYAKELPKVIQECQHFDHSLYYKLKLDYFSYLQ